MAHPLKNIPGPKPTKQRKTADKRTINRAQDRQVAKPKRASKALLPAQNNDHPVWLDCQIADLQTGRHSLRLGFAQSGSTDNSNPGYVVVGRELITQPNAVEKEILAANGRTSITPDDIQVALTSTPPRVVDMTSALGWHGDAYVEEGRTFGAQLPIHGRNCVSSLPLPSKGTLEGWRAGMETLCKESSLLTFMLASGFAGPIFELANETEGCAFYFYGQSTTGKSSGVRCTHSMRYTGRKNDLSTFDMTPRNLEEVLGRANDGTPILDEAERLSFDPTVRRKFMANLAYVSASGRGRERSHYAQRNADLRDQKWRGLILCTGENALGSDRRGVRQQGETVRLIGIPVKNSAEGGIFALGAGKQKEPKAFLKEQFKVLEATIGDNYGVVFPAFMEQLCADLPAARKRVQFYVAGFTKHVLQDGDPQEDRIGRKVAIIYAAGALAVEFGVAPWSLQMLRDSVRAIFLDAILTRSANHASENWILEQLQEAVGDANAFPTLTRPMVVPAELVHQTWGVTKRDAGQPEQIWLLKSQFLHLCGGNELVANNFFDMLAGKGIAICGPVGRAHQKQTDAFKHLSANPRPYFMVFDRKALMEAKS